MKNYTKEELYKMDAVDVYKMVLKGDVIKKFPNGFWKQPEAKQNAVKCTKYLVEEILKYDDKQLKEKNSTSLFSQNKLSGMLVTLFNGSPYEAVNNTYPDKFKEWEFKRVSRDYWNINTGVKATKWLIEEKLKLSDKKLKEQLSQKLFKDNGLKGMLSICFNGSPYQAINSVYPNKFKEWEFDYVPMNFWNIEKGIEATKWLIEEKLKLSDEEVKNQLSSNLFKINGLKGMIQYCFNDSPYEAINATYPNKFKEWEFKNTPMRFWEDKYNSIKVVKWLIEEKLKLSDKELKEQLSQNLFIDNGLRGMFNICFNGSPYEAINSAYPNKFKEWEFKNTPMRFWTKDTGIKATKWLIEEKLKLNDEELKKQLNAKLFIDNELGGMLVTLFNGSPYEAINTTYPNKFEKSDFKNYSSPFYKLK